MDIEKAMEAYNNAYNSGNPTYSEARRAGLLAAAPYLQPDAPEDVIEAMCEAYWNSVGIEEWKNMGPQGKANYRRWMVSAFRIAAAWCREHGSETPAREKTPEERVTVEGITDSFGPKYAVRDRGLSTFTTPSRMDAEIYRLGLIAKLKEGR